MSHAKQWRESMPTSFRSPFISQGDLGFFSLNKKQYGSFMLCVNTYSGFIHISKIANTKLETLVQAVGEMSKVRERGGLISNKQIKEMTACVFFTG